MSPKIQVAVVAGMSATCIGLFVSASGAAGLILNEANCVGPKKWLNNPDSQACECAGGAACATNDDVYFGRVVGNGGDWIELVVTTDHLNIQGWKLEWAETDVAGGANQASGTNIWYGNGNIEQGRLTFTNNALWADLRAGTIITITEDSTANGGLDTDTSFDPCSGDFWININASDSAYITAVNNVNGNSDGCAGTATVPPGTFNVGNDNWQLRIVNAAGTVQLGPIGEEFQGGAGWLNGTGINSREVVRLSENPSASINNFSYYEDANSSSFGHANRWSETISVSQSCSRSQDFRALRTWAACSCARIVLNEYNAVSETFYLNGGTATLDQDGQAGTTDTHFGRVLGNGGDWFELLVTDDHVDMRGAKLMWEEVADNEHGTITLSNAPVLSNLRAGTIVTFIRNTTAQGGLDTDVSYNPATNDRWININTHDVAYVAATTSTVSTHHFGDFHTSNDQWRLTILNAANQPLSISSGEGSAGYCGRGVGNLEVCDLEQDPSSATKSWDLYNASIRSTFGALNTWKSCPSTTVVTQSKSLIVPSLCTRRADVNADGVVNIDDLTAVILGWGRVNGLPGTGDVNDDGVVNIDDLTAVILGWG
ncbi:MAG TPA: hypothetical protein VG711_02955 [Phycisphaerales bacterium]|nr:hypothetical protein [Phycisphaerales bacterium]